MRKADHTRTQFWMLVVSVFVILPAVNAQSPSLTVLHSFAGGSDGRNPLAGPTLGKGGVLYGTTNYGGTPLPNGSGTIYKMTPPVTAGGSWTKTTLYNFDLPVDGGTPYAGLAEGPDGVLYGTNYSGGPLGFGTVFQFVPPLTAGGSWTYSVLYSFTNGADGGNPFSGVVIGPGGELFGTTQYPNGSVWRLTPPSSLGGAWTETTLYTFTGGADGKSPQDPHLILTSDAIYGSTVYGGAFGYGAVYKLVSQVPGKPWKETVLYSFAGLADGIRPVLSAMGANGELYGTTDDFSTDAHGTVYELAPTAGSPDVWNYSLLYSFTGRADGGAPTGGVSLTPNGDLIGTAQQGGLHISPCGGGCGVLFELDAPSAAGDPWTEQAIYTFRNQSDGSNPQGLITRAGTTLYAVSSSVDQGTTIGNGAVVSLKK